MSADRRSPTEWSKRLVETLVSSGRIQGDTAVAVLSEAGSSGRPVAAELADRGVLAGTVAPRRVRLVTHAGVSDDDVAYVAEAMKGLASATR